MSVSVALRGVLSIVGIMAAMHLAGLWEPEDVENFETFQLAVEWIIVLFLVFEIIPSVINHFVKVPGARSMLLDMTLIVGLLLCITMTGQLNPATDTTQVTILMVVMLAFLLVFRKAALPRILAKAGKKEVNEDGENSEEIL